VLSGGNCKKLAHVNDAWSTRDGGETWTEMHEHGARKPTLKMIHIRIEIDRGLEKAGGDDGPAVVAAAKELPWYSCPRPREVLRSALALYVRAATSELVAAECAARASAASDVGAGVIGRVADWHSRIDAAVAAFDPSETAVDTLNRVRAIQAVRGEISAAAKIVVARQTEAAANAAELLRKLERLGRPVGDAALRAQVDELRTAAGAAESRAAAAERALSSATSRLAEREALAARLQERVAELEA
jgi:hypothetical protein